jgi:hypothetical protein
MSITTKAVEDMLRANPGMTVLDRPLDLTTPQELANRADPPTNSANVYVGTSPMMSTVDVAPVTELIKNEDGDVIGVRGVLGFGHQPGSTQGTAAIHIEQVCNSLSHFLLAKNRNYGNSALEPMQVFNKAESGGILMRIDDKLSRIKNSQELRRNDVVDLAGYLVLLCIDQGWTDFTDLID